jgi:hypothetical protein
MRKVQPTGKLRKLSNNTAHMVRKVIVTWSDGKDLIPPWIHGNRKKTWQELLPMPYEISGPLRELRKELYDLIRSLLSPFIAYPF